MNDSKRYLKKSVQSFPCGEVMKNGFIRISGQMSRNFVWHIRIILILISNHEFYFTGRNRQSLPYQY